MSEIVKMIAQRSALGVLNLFIVSMLILVLGENFGVLFIGWELVGVSSYLLISFWFEKPSAGL